MSVFFPPIESRISLLEKRIEEGISEDFRIDRQGPRFSPVLNDWETDVDASAMLDTRGGGRFGREPKTREVSERERERRGIHPERMAYVNVGRCTHRVLEHIGGWFDG